VNAAELIRLKQEHVERYGPWTAHNIHLGDGVYTMGTPVMGGNEARLRRAVQVCADLVALPFEELRVADLGALEGGFAVEFASRGARVVAIEGRESSIKKACFAKAALGLDALELVHDDVRNFDEQRFGRFDIVLAVGLVYHLDIPEVFDFLSKMRAACKRIAIVDTEITPESQARNVFDRNGVTYRGLRYEEPTGPALDRDVLWSSLGNRQSFKPTRASLLNALFDSGFTSAFECHLPPVRDGRAERATIIAVSGLPQEFITNSSLNDAPLARVPEFDLVLDKGASPLARRLRRRLPTIVRRGAKRVLGRS
jgi:2-polyprenyl-3-methyl-5-hydroxy-6-metoxy-1,4-benzoquinol methylase